MKRNPFIWTLGLTAALVAPATAQERAGAAPAASLAEANVAADLEGMTAQVQTLEQRMATLEGDYDEIKQADVCDCASIQQGLEDLEVALSYLSTQFADYRSAMTGALQKIRADLTNLDMQIQQYHR